MICLVKSPLQIGTHRLHLNAVVSTTHSNCAGVMNLVQAVQTLLEVTKFLHGKALTEDLGVHLAVK